MAAQRILPRIKAPKLEPAPAAPEQPPAEPVEPPPPEPPAPRRRREPAHPLSWAAFRRSGDISAREIIDRLF
jgi:hypothetical protein